MSLTTSEVWNSASNLPEGLQTTIHFDHLITSMLIYIAVTLDSMYGQKLVTILKFISISIQFLSSLIQIKAWPHIFQDMARCLNQRKDGINMCKAQLETDDSNEHTFTITSNKNRIAEQTNVLLTDEATTNSSKDVNRPKPNSYQRSIKEDIHWIFTQLPSPRLDNIPVFYTERVEPLSLIISQIAEGKSPRPQVTMRYELLRICTLRTYPQDNKPFLIKYAAAGFYYASDGDGVVCYCCGIRRYGWVETDDPMEVHRIINPRCNFIINNSEHNVPAIADGPLRQNVSRLEDMIPDCIRAQSPGEDGSQRTRTEVSASRDNFHSRLVISNVRANDTQHVSDGTEGIVPASRESRGSVMSDISEGANAGDTPDEITDVVVGALRSNFHPRLVISNVHADAIQSGIDGFDGILPDSREARGSVLSDIDSEGATAGDTQDENSDVVFDEPRS